MKKYKKIFDPVHMKAHNRIMVCLIMGDIGDMENLGEDIENMNKESFDPSYWNWVLEPLRAIGVQTCDELEDFLEWVQDNFPFGEWNLKYIKNR